ncbi:HNH endonuclease [Agrobacterium pusense]|uniref:HNH endonuclease n=1 Tax=Agrobacterium pusense TaxID=648995 RepID=UPI000D1A4445|nr:HNH endonuclease [Agrobacterium pusense]
MAEAHHHECVPSVKVCEACGGEYRKKKGVSIPQWMRSRSCSRGCNTTLGQRNRKWPSKAERFWSKVDRAPGHGRNGDCWPWQGAMLPDGYGHFRDGDKVRPAHVVSYELENGPLPEGMNGLHSCDYRRCVNPSHIFAGTHQDNMSDMVAKGRANAPKGVDHHDVKLTEDEVRAIRADGRKQRDIAADYGVSQSAIMMIKTRRNWRHLE